MSNAVKPAPAGDPATREYWEAASRGEFRIPLCTACGRHHLYPRTICPHCGSSALAWSDSPGTGEVYSYTVVHRAPSPAFEADVPYVVAVIQLDEGPHLMTNLLDITPEAVRIGQRVRVAFRAAGEDGALIPVFKPDEGPGAP
jgi:uncharacterized OB-fold protein